MNGRAGLFLDRDGVVNRPPLPPDRYITRPEDFVLQPGIAPAVRACNLRGIPVAVVTNQKCIATGLLSEAGLARIHRRMAELLAAEGAEVQAVRHCPHREQDGCACRKPLPGMILDAAAALGVDPARSWMVGDQPRDLEAGRAAGCRTLFLGPDAAAPAQADAVLTRSGDLPAWIARIFPFPAER